MPALQGHASILGQPAVRWARLGWPSGGPIKRPLEATWRWQQEPGPSTGKKKGAEPAVSKTNSYQVPLCCGTLLSPGGGRYLSCTPLARGPSFPEDDLCKGHAGTCTQVFQIQSSSTSPRLQTQAGTRMGLRHEGQPTS